MNSTDEKVLRDFSLDKTEKQVLLFLSRSVFKILEESGALKGLSNQERAFHVARFTIHTRKGLTVTEENVPYITEAKSLARKVIRELEDRYGDKLKMVLLDTRLDVETAIVLCLQKHATWLLEERTDLSSESWLELLCTLALYSGIGFFMVFFLLLMFDGF